MNNIDQKQLNRTIDGALENLWVKLIEDNKFATGAELHEAIISTTYGVLIASIFDEWSLSRGFEWEYPVGDWE